VLVAAALAKGGRDNVTVVIVESTWGDPDHDTDVTRERPTGMHEHLEDTRPRTTNP